MKHRPILFSTSMVRAILEGRKTQTRRVIKPEPEGRGLRTTNVQFEDWHGNEVKCPYGEVGDILWVRESWALEKYFNGLTEECFFKYKADFDGPVDWNWKPSIHMPKKAARLFLKITDIHVERLQDISTSDCMKEGYMPPKIDDIFDQKVIDTVSRLPESHRHIAISTAPQKELTESPRLWFEKLWKSINGEDSWNANDN